VARSPRTLARNTRALGNLVLTHVCAKVLPSADGDRQAADWLKALPPRIKSRGAAAFCMLNAHLMPDVNALQSEHCCELENLLHILRSSGACVQPGVLLKSVEDAVLKLPLDVLAVQQAEKVDTLRHSLRT
jgi:hypothetical protein